MPVCILGGPMIRALVAILLLVGSAGAEPAPAAAAAPPAPPNLNCPGTEYRQFDFMLGDWGAGRTGSNTTTARSQWTKLGPCSILEHWMPQPDRHGYSLNYFDSADGKWHQHWVDATGDAVHYVGEWRGGKMEFMADDVSSPGGQALKLTMTFEPLAGDTVRQSGTQSTDGGKTFVPTFDLTYSRAAK